MARGLPRGPRWVRPVVAVSVVVAVVLTLLVLHRPAGIPAAAAGTPQTTRPVRILVVGDSYTAGGREGGAGKASWAHLVAQDLTAAGRRVTLEVAAAGGSGYVRTGPRHTTFVQLARRTRSQRDLVVFFGSRNDIAAAPEVQAAAEAAFAAVRAASPRAALLVVGPPWVDADPPDYIRADRDAVGAAARAAGATFVDPLAEGWFTGRAERFIGTGSIHPTDSGHRYMAGLLLPRIERLLPPEP
jgi:lysophospholipase L1-like esterase